MDITIDFQCEKQLKLRKKLQETKELRRSGVPNIPACTASANLRAFIKKTFV